MIKTLYDKATANIILNGQKVKYVSLTSGTRKECRLSPFLSSILLEVLATVIRQETEINILQIGKEEVKLFIHDMIMYIQNPVLHQKDTRSNK